MTTTDLSTPPPEHASAPRWRRIVAVVLVVLASLMLVVSVIGVWAKRTVLDTDRFSSVVQAVVEDPDVDEALALRISTELTAALAASPALDRVIPAALAPAEPLLLGALQSWTTDQLTDLLGSPRIQGLVVSAAEVAHRRAIDLLQGGGLTGEGLTVQEGTVTLNVVPLIEEVLLRLQQRGVISSNVELPAPGQQVEVPAQIQQLADRLGVQLDDDFGQIVVYQSEQLADAQTTLAEAQRALVFVQRAVVLLVVLAVVLVALALLVSTNRLRTLAQLGVGVTLLTVLAYVVINRVVDDLPGVVEAPGAQIALTTGLDAATAPLRRALIALAIIGIVMAVGGYLFGRAGSGTRLRAGAGLTTAGSWASDLVSRHPDAATVIVLAAAVVLILVAGLSWLSVLLALAIVVGGVVWVRWSARRTTPSPMPRGA